MQLYFASLSFPVDAYFYGQVFHLMMFLYKKKKKGNEKILKVSLLYLVAMFQCIVALIFCF